MFQVEAGLRDKILAGGVLLGLVKLSRRFNPSLSGGHHAEREISSLALHSSPSLSQLLQTGLFSSQRTCRALQVELRDSVSVKRTSSLEQAQNRRSNHPDNANVSCHP